MSDKTPIVDACAASFEDLGVSNDTLLVTADKARELETLAGELAEALQSAGHHCRYLHHGPGDYHEEHPCPVEERIGAALTRFGAMREGK